MTCDERIEELLNRAGQTISDLPTKGFVQSEPYPLSALPEANGAAWNWYLNIGGDLDDWDSTRSKMVLKLYILHLTDIIDRMETALENVCGQRDYMTAKYAPGPYEPVPEDWKIPEEMDEVLAPLKTQEPRVLMLDELKECTEYYMDEKGSNKYDVLLINIVNDAIEPFMVFNFEGGCVGLNISDYGKDWRCWSCRPTDEQREAVKWDV